MERYLFSLIGLIFSGSIGAFFLYVPMWPITLVALLMIGLITMFVLGLFVGRERNQKSQEPSSDFAADGDDEGPADAGVRSGQRGRSSLDVSRVNFERR
jgi:hypothetical protein